MSKIAENWHRDNLWVDRGKNAENKEFENQFEWGTCLIKVMGCEQMIGTHGIRVFYVQ